MTIPAASENNFPKARFGPSYLSVTMGKIFKWSASRIHCEGLQTVPIFEYRKKIVRDCLKINLKRVFNR